MRVLAALIVALVGGGTSARADPPSDLGARPLVLGEHQLAAALTVEADLARGAAGAPVSVAPDLWFGATAHLTVGIIHSDPTIDRIGTGAGVCIACDHAYRGGGVEARYSVRAGDLALAPRARLLIRGLAPLEPALTVGALARWTHGRFAITSDPYLRIGLANRDINPPAVVLPLWLEIQPARRWSAALHTGWGASLPVAPNAWHVPLALDLRLRATAAIELFAEVGFTSLVGPDNHMQERALALTAAWHD